MNDPCSDRTLTRRNFCLLTGAAGAALYGGLTLRGQAQPGRPRQMKMALAGGIGVNAKQGELIRLAAKYGFEAVEANAGYLGSLSDDALKGLRQELADKKLAWGNAGFPLQFRDSEEAFQKSLKDLPKFAAALKRAGAERTGTWISPGHATLTREENLKQHADRLRAGAQILRDHGLRLGLEYVGTRNMQTKSKYPFIHNMAGGAGTDRGDRAG